MAPSRGRKWQTELGRATIRRIVAEKIPEWTGGLHEWQVKVVAWILDGEDVLCITATGDGKSAIFAVPIIVLLEVARDPAAYPGFAHYKKPVGLVIAPTKGLAANIVFELAQLRVPALACTSDTLTEARISRRNIASEIASCCWPIVVVDPEHLMEKMWERITDSHSFRENMAFTSVDEAHLIDEWGAEFRPAFKHLGNFVRRRLPPHISVNALTATMEPGTITNSICKSLGFLPGMFHTLRRSNERPNIQFLLRPLTHTLGGEYFPDLLEYLLSMRKTIIYCATVDLCWRVYVYLLRLLPPGPKRLIRVRLYHAMCWPDENEKTVALMRDDPMCQIIVATVAFGQGFNVRSLLDSIQLGVPKTVAQGLQQGGRVARDPAATGRAVILAQATAYTSAQKFLARDKSMPRAPAKNSKSLTTMNQQKAMMLTTKGCLIAFFNKVYGNATPGSQLDCIALPRPLPCSNCLPRFTGTLEFAPSPLPAAPQRLRPFTKPKAPVLLAEDQPKMQKLTLKMRAAADEQLRKFRAQVQKLERDYDVYGCTPASSYLSNPVITALLDSLLRIWTCDVMVTKIPQWKHHERHGAALFALIRTLQLEFAAQFEAARLAKNKTAREKRRGKHAVSDADSEGGSGDNDDSAGEDSEEHDDEPTAPTAAVAAGSGTSSQSRKRPLPLADTTNASRKRPRAPAAQLKSMAATAESFGPGYRPRVRRFNEEN